MQEDPLSENDKTQNILYKLVIASCIFFFVIFFIYGAVYLDYLFCNYISLETQFYSHISHIYEILDKSADFLNAASLVFTNILSRIAQLRILLWQL